MYEEARNDWDKWWEGGEDAIFALIERLEKIPEKSKYEITQEVIYEFCEQWTDDCRLSSWLREKINPEI